MLYMRKTEHMLIIVEFMSWEAQWGVYFFILLRHLRYDRQRMRSDSV